jgi:3-carboxy-cis,cis-muconate cycloisomerase
MTTHLTDSLGTTEALEGVFSDGSLLQAMLDFEAALARAEARLGVIPAHVVDAIEASAKAEHYDARRIAGEARASATVSIPVVRALTAHVRVLDPESATYVHWGATSQDVVDSAIAIVLRQAKSILAGDHDRLVGALRQLSDLHARTVMLGRTLLQPAPPITFGLKAAGWVAALRRGWTRVDAAFDAAAVAQLGGAAGTLAALGDRGLAVARALAEELKIPAPAAPWHTDRDRLGALVASAGVYTATLGKVARDIALLMQDEIGEAAEPGGGSSTMPHKRNPSGCATVLAAATRMPGLVAAFLAGMVQEHERGVGGWQAEWPTVAAAVQATGAAAAALADAAVGLTIHPERMRANIERIRGVVFAERVVMLLAPRVGKDAAQALVQQALAQTGESGLSFKDALGAIPDVARVLTREELGTIDVPEMYLGQAEALRLNLLA